MPLYTSHVESNTSPAGGGVRCFHCEEIVSTAVPIYATVAGQQRLVCCQGCRAVAELIAGVGLGDYYEFRTAPAASPRDSNPSDNEWLAFDQTELLQQLTRIGPDGTRSARLGIEGMGCAACGWLVDRMLRRQSDVCAVSVDTVTACMSVSWRAPRKFSDILQTIAHLGLRPYPLDAANAYAARRDEQRDALKRLAVAGFGMMQVMMFAVGLYSGDRPGLSGMDAVSREYLRIVSLLCTLPVLLYAGRPILMSAWHAVRARSVVMDVPVSVALLLAFGASVVNTFSDRGAIYFDSVVMFLFFLILGRFVEMRARHRTVGVTDALARLLPRTAHVVRRDSGFEAVTDVPLTSLKLDDEVIVRAGEIVPVDGVVIEGCGRFDESMLTGESLPVTRAIGAKVAGGVLNLHSPVRLRVTALGSATVLSGIVRLLQDGVGTRSTTPTAADKAASWFLSRILVAAGFVAAAWIWIDPSKAFDATLAVLVVTCPCALSLALPAAYAAATASLARRGILVIKQTAFDALSKVTVVAFDKTGTLTRGEPTLNDCRTYADLSRRECETIAAALERHSEHPLARAFASLDVGSAQASRIEIVAGMGIEGTIDGRRYRLGKRNYAAAAFESRDDAANEWIFLGDGAQTFASFRITDLLRTEAPSMAQRLAARSVRSEILSGDCASAVQAAAKQCGIDRFRSSQSPADKLEHLRDLTRKGEIVAMVGDGINDAPVLAGAAVSVAMGGATALAHATADLILMRDSLDAALDAIDVARRTARVVRQNLFWGITYNFVALPLAALGYVPPWLAAVGMSLSSMLVVLNALRLAPSVAVRSSTRSDRDSSAAGTIVADDALRSTEGTV